MGFCGSCGKRADPEDKFCTVCGMPIKEATVSVLEETGELIKEEYRTSTAPPDASTSRGTHIGDQKKGGEWLESTVEHILRYSGFQTTRNAPFVFNDSTGDHFRIDVLASDANIEIFVECKDYSDQKISEKIMYTLTGQIDDYRKRNTKNVIGILAITARDDGRNLGISERLRKQNSFLWDGSFIEHLQNKMAELGNKEDFRRYLLDHLDVFEAPTIKSSGVYNFMIKYSFYTISPDRYVGKPFDVSNIIDDINDALKESGIQIINRKFEAILQEGRILSYRMIVDFNFPMSNDAVRSYAQKHKGWLDKLKRRNDFEIVYRDYRKIIESQLQRVYGIRCDPKSKSHFDQVTFEGSRIK